MALPLAVFEDRNVPAAQANGAIAAMTISSPARGEKRKADLAPIFASGAGVQQRRMQPEAPHSLAGSVMLVRSREHITSQLPPSYPASTAKHATDRPEELVLPADILSPPSPRSMQILGKSRGLKRDRLDSTQPTPPAKRPAINPNSAAKARPQKGKAAARSLPVPPPQPAQPVGSNWWSQGSPGQLAQNTSQSGPAAQPSITQDHSYRGGPSPSGAEYKSSQIGGTLPAGSRHIPPALQSLIMLIQGASSTSPTIFLVGRQRMSRNTLKPRPHHLLCPDAAWLRQVR